MEFDIRYILIRNLHQSDDQWNRMTQSWPDISLAQLKESIGNVSLLVHNFGRVSYLSFKIDRNASENEFKQGKY
ncbi:hypothetical protein BpHYR1_027761 [Brachionus plicatilis]|uniref:Uncharacterized protein n=1 Tax=Brachionus plicatilis TaxID=10195 RepID=A0A3M7RB31_BRAPC|nr:hypothetical protein BpHYR1_027761 [Brachionus plicatilis]